LNSSKILQNPCGSEVHKKSNSNPCGKASVKRWSIENILILVLVPKPSF
jgi:hypothetical protein